MGTGFWLGFAQAQNAHQEKQQEESLQQAKARKQQLIDYFAKQAENVSEQAAGPFMQHMQGLMSIDITKPNSLKQLDKVAQTDITQWLKTQQQKNEEELSRRSQFAAQDTRNAVAQQKAMMPGEIDKATQIAQAQADAKLLQLRISAAAKGFKITDDGGIERMTADEIALQTPGVSRQGWRRNSKSSTGWELVLLGKDGSEIRSVLDMQAPTSIAGTTSKYGVLVQSGNQIIEVPMTRTTSPNSLGSAPVPPPMPQGGGKPSASAAPPAQPPQGSPTTGRSWPARLTSAELGGRVTSAQLLQEADELFALANKHRDVIGPISGRATRWGMQNIPEVLSTDDMQNPEVIDLFNIANNARNQLLYALSGKQINEKEYERLGSLIPDPSTPAATFFSRLARYTQRLRGIQEMKAKGTWGWTPLSAKYKQQLQAAGLPDPDLDPNLQPPDADKAIAAPKLDAFEE